MDPKKLILSGRLEMYVLELLPPEDRKEIALMARVYPEVQKEIERINEVLKQRKPDDSKY